jgi:hypothetical protein
MSYVNIVRLSSGEEIICEFDQFIDEDGDWGIIKNPAILIPGNEGKLMFAKWLPYMKQTDGVKIRIKDVLFKGEPMDDLKDHYMSVVVNNLFVPQKKITGPQLKLALD